MTKFHLGNLKNNVSSASPNTVTKRSIKNLYKNNLKIEKVNTSIVQNPDKSLNSATNLGFFREIPDTDYFSQRTNKNNYLNILNHYDYPLNKSNQEICTHCYNKKLVLEREEQRNTENNISKSVMDFHYFLNNNVFYQ